ncbi:MAG: HNH endonuclease [Candidatus Gastranaerophilaceae bacterium]
MIEPIKSNINFGYTTILSKLWKEEKLPEVTKGFYGGTLSHDVKSLDYCTNEHIRPHSQGGKTDLKNIALSTAQNNNNRGNRPLSEFFNKEAFEEYCEQFKKLLVPYQKGNKTKIFSGDEYAKNIKKTVYNILEEEKKLNILG